MFYAHRWQTLSVTSWVHPGLKFWSQKWLGRKVSCKINKSYPSGVTDFIQSGINGLMISIANTCSHFAALPALAFIFTTFYVGVKVIIACNTISLNFCALLLIAVDIVPCSWCSIYPKLAAARGDGAGDHVSSFDSHVGHTQGNYSFFSFSFSFVVFALDTSCIRGAISSCMRWHMILI